MPVTAWTARCRLRRTLGSAAPSATTMTPRISGSFSTRMMGLCPPSVETVAGWRISLDCSDRVAVAPPEDSDTLSSRVLTVAATRSPAVA